MWIVVQDRDGVTHKYNLDALASLNISEREEAWTVGVSLEQVYKASSGRIILQTNSLWQLGNSGRATGRQYHVASDETIAELFRRTGDERLLSSIPERE